MGEPALADLAVSAAVVDADTAMGEIEGLVQADPGMLGVVTVVDGVHHLVARARLDVLLAGRLGYGRALLHRRPLRAVIGEPALVLPAATTWDDAARVAIGRPDHRKSNPIVVAFDDGTLGLAPVGPLVEYLSGRYAAMAFTDELTGLGNRRKLASPGAVVPGALFLIDLNRFKEINDALGHARGDELLRHVASALSAACAPAPAYRLGGDEFVIRTADGWPAGPLADAGRDLLRAIEGPFHVAGVPITVEAAVGIAEGEAGLDELLARADAAMYLAKRDRTRVEVWARETAVADVADLGMETDLRSAIANHELVLHYQPLVHARSGQVASYEALVRWAHPERGLLSPRSFLPRAELSDVIHPLTEAVLAEAIGQAACWHRAGRTMPVAVNLAAPVLASEGIVAIVERLLERSGLPPEALIVEVTESAVMTRPDQSADRLRAIRAMGVRIAMDDFGTGYTSLELLTRLPLDELKLDRSFVMRVHEPQERVIVEAVARMANGLGLTLVAEGVEDSRTAETLAAIGFDLLQGYHFGRPEPAAAHNLVPGIVTSG
ncbi:diguanylate cyclase (GGDEF)-like protein [Actinoplanes lutulentus]|uniref:Diguanylate cyclase (GGDEF)-like protein n=1 Tax=Actinoplanes lutulentus TaxID=1287878 RepID=A0A327ZR24_9ACTN|nr:EAL domain-containing protein [Actinoplanes lutulentus]MBB2941179.1 diguanylate cyclase (GGDEF)-like protein [Actinoplanes lutulentus]RAK43488.1 diguanylate cyclase (GGDEF)-like protein [Actinoplanes lutulentus]